MTASESKPRWKRALLGVLKVYAGFCTILVTAYLGLGVWLSFSTHPPTGGEEITLMSAYGAYMAKEYPRRSDNFNGLAVVLADRGRAVPLRCADVQKFLGKPDFIQGDSENGTLVYTYHPSGRSDPWEMFAFLEDGKLKQVGFNGASANDHTLYRPYSDEETLNPQGGASGRQPFISGTNRTSAAAASRRSP